MRRRLPALLEDADNGLTSQAREIFADLGVAKKGSDTIFIGRILLGDSGRQRADVASYTSDGLGHFGETYAYDARNA